MIETKGELKYCPFRVNTLASYTIPDETYQVFAKCLKEDCMCYEAHSHKDGITEFCWRDNLGYQRTRQIGGEEE